MDPAYIVLTVMIALVGVAAKVMHDISQKCNDTKEGLIAVETKIDIYLAHAGFDIPKVNKAIKEHIDELKQNGKPSVGCIRIEELRKDK